MPAGRLKKYTPEEAYEAKLISGRKAGAKWRAKNDRSKYSRKYDKDRPLNIKIFRSMQARATFYNISPDDIFVPDTCPICNCRMTPSNVRGGSAVSPTLDKVFPEKGYIKGNIAVICKLCNSQKGNASAEQHRRIADYIDQF